VSAVGSVHMSSLFLMVSMWVAEWVKSAVVWAAVSVVG